MPFYFWIFIFFHLFVQIDSRQIELLPSPRSISFKNKSWVSNVDSIILNSTANQINTLLDKFYQDEEYWGVCGSTRKGYEIAVVLVQNMSLEMGENKKTEATRLAKYLHDKWGVGHKECSNGVLFFLSKEDREMYISTGKGIKHILTDSFLFGVIDHIRYYLKQEQYDKGILEGINMIINRLKYQEQCSIRSPYGICPEGQCCFEGKCDSKYCSKSNESENTVIGFIFLVVFFGIFFGRLIYPCYISMRDRPRRMRDRQRLDQLREELKTKNKIPTPLCAICLVDFEDENEVRSAESNKDQKNTESEVETKENSQDDEGSHPELRIRKNTSKFQSQESKSNDTSKVEKSEKPETLVCGHQFHASCLNSWLSVKNSCPVCRQEDPRDPPTEGKDRKTPKSYSSERQNVFDDDVLIFAYSRLNAPRYYVRPVPYEPSTSSSSYDSDSGFGGGDSGGGGGAGGSW